MSVSVSEPHQLRQAFVGLGANLGDRAAALKTACERLADTPGLDDVLCSPLYETEPVGPVTEQPLFLNAVAAVSTSLGPEDLLSQLHRIESSAGRRRSQEVRWGPRPLDLDLLLFEGATQSGPELELPHPLLWVRPFVTVPLSDLLADTTRFPDIRWGWARTRLAGSPRGPGVRTWSKAAR